MLTRMYYGGEPMTTITAVPRGRPRDEAIDHKVLRATCELLGEVGFAETTIQAIARRAGVGPSAIYRRWPSRVELIEQAIFPGFDDVCVTPTGDIRADLASYVDALGRAFVSPAARAGVPGLLSTYQSNPAAYSSHPFPAGNTARVDFRRMFELAEPGTVNPAVNPDDVFDLLIGSILYRIFVMPFMGRPVRDDHTVELLLRAVSPAT